MMIALQDIAVSLGARPLLTTFTWTKYLKIALRNKCVSTSPTTQIFQSCTNMAFYRDEESQTAL